MGEVARPQAATPTPTTHLVTLTAEDARVRGSPATNLITDSTGASLHTQRFHPFGKNEAPAYGTTGVLTGFTGHDDEADLGLVNMKGRLYDPTTGRFTTPDPFVQAVGWSQGLNRYSYAWNNPLRWIDPTGFDGEAQDDLDDADAGIEKVPESAFDPMVLESRNSGFMEDPASYSSPAGVGTDFTPGGSRQRP